jgi:hypothetical protein
MQLSKVIILCIYWYLHVSKKVRSGPVRSIHLVGSIKSKPFGFKKNLCIYVKLNFPSCHIFICRTTLKQNQKCQIRRGALMMSINTIRLSRHKKLYSDAYKCTSYNIFITTVDFDVMDSLALTFVYQQDWFDSFEYTAEWNRIDLVCYVLQLYPTRWN